MVILGIIANASVVLMLALEISKEIRERIARKKEKR